MDNKIVNIINNEIEDGEIFSSSDNDDASEILENTKYTTNKTTKFLSNVNIKTVLEKNVFAGVNKNIMEKSNNNRVDRKRPHDRNSMNITDEKSQEYMFDDDLNIFIRGGSPPIKNFSLQNNYDSKPLYYDEISCDSEDNFDKYSMYERKKRRRHKKNKNGYDKYKNKHRTKGQRFKTNGVGGGTDNNDQFKRNKLCKFFLHNKCYRPSQCVFMHGEFPCKYYYLGLKCPDDKNCKLDHGKPLNDDMKEALLLHIQFAPDECLGNFQKIPSEVADKLFADRAMEFKLNEIQLSKIKLEESTVHKYDTNKKNNEKCNISDLKDEEVQISDDTNNGKIQNSNHDILDDNIINIPIIKEFLNSDIYRICLDDLDNNKNVESLIEMLPIENKIENLPIHFNDIDERIKENLKKSIQSENYDDPNFKFFMIQFFLSLNHNKTNLNLNDIPQTLNIENYKEYLTEIQIVKLKELGINFVHHLSLLSLANLNSLGISITQISQIQDKSLTNENVKGSPTKKEEEEQFDMTENETESLKDNCTQVSSTSVDTDMRILPPVYSPDKWSGIVDTDCRVLSQSLDETQNDLIIDEESELIIDESILSDSCDEDDLIFLHEKYKLENLINDNFDKKVSDLNDNLEKEEKTNKLLQQQIDFKPARIKTELETNDHDIIPELPLSPTEISFTHLIEQNMKKEYNGDMDMRFPFVSMVDFLPATEINGSLNLHDEIEYTLNEILIPEKKPLSFAILVKLEPNHLDPRLRKEYFNREHSINNKKDFTIENTKNININHNEINNINNNNNINEINNNTNLNNKDMKITNKENIINIEQENLTINIDETIKLSSTILGIDPRKRYEIQSPPLLEPLSIVTKNINQLSERNKIEQHPSSIQFLHFYLQKSHWYNDQNSKRKIEINELIAFLARSIKNYHQENIPNKHFNILNLSCAPKITEILMNLGIDIDCNGYIIEINRLTQNNNNNEHEQLLQELNNNDQNNFNNAGIDFMYNKNSNIINNNQLYPMRFFKTPPLIPSLISMPSLSSVPKPGLLGFAPGVPCANSNTNMSSSFWCPSSQNYYHKNAQVPSYMMQSHHSNFQQKIHSNVFQRNHRKMNGRI